MNRGTCTSLIRSLLVSGAATAMILTVSTAGTSAEHERPTVTVVNDATELDAPPHTRTDQRGDTNPGDTNPGDTNPGYTAAAPGGAPRTGGLTAGVAAGRGTGSSTAGTDSDSVGEQTSAAAKLGWGSPSHVDEFRTGLGPDWQVYDGPGHDGKGERSPSAVSVQNGIMTITGDAKGTTAGMALDTGQKYGRWEGRVRAPQAADSYHAVMLLWPDAENWPVGGEVDFMEMSDPERATTDAFLHFGKDNSQVHHDVQTDATAWHNWAVEWTPQAVTAYLDGKQWFRSTDPKTLPPGPMHLCIQLDWFPGDGDTRTSTMQVDWVKQYALDGGRGPTATDQLPTSAELDDANPAADKNPTVAPTGPRASTDRRLADQQNDSSDCPSASQVAESAKRSALGWRWTTRQDTAALANADPRRRGSR